MKTVCSGRRDFLKVYFCAQRFCEVISGFVKCLRIVCYVVCGLLQFYNNDSLFCVVTENIKVHYFKGAIDILCDVFCMFMLHRKLLQK